MIVYLQLIDTAEDRSKFEQLYEQYKQLMFYTAFQILKRPQDAEDAVHHAFLSIAENISKISDPDCPKTRAYIVTIVERKGTVIYDETEADVSSKVENDLAQTTTADTEIIADRDILQEARNVLADTSYSIQSVNISDAEEITGKCLNLTLTLSNADDSSVSRISSVYDNLESYSCNL